MFITVYVDIFYLLDQCLYFQFFFFREVFMFSWFHRNDSVEKFEIEYVFGDEAIKFFQFNSEQFKKNICILYMRVWMSFFIQLCIVQGKISNISWLFSSTKLYVNKNNSSLSNQFEDYYAQKISNPDAELYLVLTNAFDWWNHSQ